MDAIPISAGQPLPPLDAATPEQVPERFAELRARFDRDATGANDENSWKILRDAWVGRKSGVLMQVSDTWLKPAKPELKRAVGQALNEFKAHVETAIETRRLEIEAAGDQASPPPHAPSVAHSIPPPALANASGAVDRDLYGCRRRTGLKRQVLMLWRRASTQPPEVEPQYEPLKFQYSTAPRYIAQ